MLVRGRREVERRDDPAAHESPRHAQALQPLLEQALEQAAGHLGGRRAHLRRHRPRRLHRAAARGLDRAGARQGHDLPFVGVSSLEALARGVELVSPNELDLPGKPEVSGPVLAVIDARRGEVFAAVYRHHRTTMEPSR